MTGYRIRLRVRMGKAFTTDEPILRATIAGHEIEIASQTKREPLRNTSWLIYTARGFSDEPSAQAFGEQLVAAVELAALYSRLGVDIGSNQPTG